jgi:hypothetical protein
MVDLLLGGLNMESITFFIIGFCVILISLFITKKLINIKIIKYLPSIICFIGLMYFGIGPQIFHYVHGITLGIYYMILGMIFGIALLTSLVTLIYYNLIKKNIY